MKDYLPVVHVPNRLMIGFFMGLIVMITSVLLWAHPLPYSFIFIIGWSLFYALNLLMRISLNQTHATIQLLQLLGIHQQCIRHNLRQQMVRISLLATLIAAGCICLGLYITHQVSYPFVGLVSCAHISLHYVLIRLSVAGVGPSEQGG